MKASEKKWADRTAIFLFVCGLIVFWGFEVSGQEWDQAQKEVWEAVQSYWESLKLGDADNTTKILHDDAVDWWNKNTSPHKKESLKDAYQRWFAYDKPVSYELHPLTVQLFDNVAVVSYYFSWKGNRLSDRGQAFQTWLRQDNQWLLIGSIRPSCDKLPTCFSP